MMEWMILASNILMGGLRVAACLVLIYRMLETEKPDRRSTFIGFVVGVVIAIGLGIFQLPDFYRMALEAIAIACCAKHFQRADARMSLFVSIFYEIAISFWQFLLAAGLGILFHSEKFLDGTNICGLSAVWLIHLFVIAMVCYVVRQQNMERKSSLRVASMVALVGFMAVVTLSEQSILAIPEDTLDMWMILSMVLLMSVLVFHMNRQYEVEKELASLKTEQAELLERDYTALNNAYAANAKLFHDLHNHLGALRQLLSREKYEKAIAYLDELQEPIREIADTVWTGDETVDYLINSKVAVATSEEIQLQVEVEFPRHANIRSADLCAILGNLLDNALEAVRKVQEPERRSIKLTIRRINQMLVIKVQNHFAEPLAMENGSLKTTKTDAGLHGWGLKSAQTAVEKYDGMIRTSCEGDMFRAVATLSFDGVSIK